MISWLLAVVLLFAPAITTPTSTEPTQQATRTATTPSPSLPPSTIITTTTAGAHQLHRQQQQPISSVLASSKLLVQTRDDFAAAEQDLGANRRLAVASANEANNTQTTTNLMFEYPTFSTTAVAAAITPNTNTTPNGANSNTDNNTNNNYSNKSENVINNTKEEKLLRKKSLQQQPVFTNQFVIQVQGGEEAAKELAEKHGFIYLNHILGDYYHLEHRRLAKRSLDATDMSQLEISIEDEPQVIKFERQVLKKRVKRDFLDLGNPPPPTNNVGNSMMLSYKQQQQQQQQLLNNRQLLRPNLQQPPTTNAGATNRPAATTSSHHQFTRPANQLPVVANSQQQPGRNFNAIPPHRSFEANQANSRRPTTPSAASSSSSSSSSQLPPTSLHPSQHSGYAAAATFGANNNNLAHRTNAFGLNANILDALDGASSGPLPFFMQPQQGVADNSSNLSHKQRPLPAPIVLVNPSSSTFHHSNSNESANNRAGGGGQSSQHSSTATYSNQTVRPAPFSDPSWPLMWYLDGGARNGFDLNVQAAWRMGYTGKGIVITILDDGLEKDHPDLQANYDPLASFDINSDDADPMPRYDPNDSNRHGTRCAGEVAAVPGNNICSIGIAYNSKVGGVRMLDGDVTDAVEARSLSLNSQHIHIYSASWGPDDNGKTVDGPGEMATRAFIEGVTNGRQGLGSIFVFASGNGGREHDNCNCDGYTNSIWTLSISSATENGYVPWYIEACSSTLATTYSSGSYDERQIATTDIRHSCTSNHTGTSASAPLAAGICALVLESNPRLTWRDMQHIVVRTAKPANLLAKDWRTNALGRNVSHAFGYGLMDAAGMITMAKQWTTVPVQYTCEVRSPQMEKYIPPNGYIELKLRAECANVRFLEHVQSKVTLSASRRGDLHIYLTSPLGTRSTLLAQRPNDQAEQGFRNWPFMTVHSWGEPPNGIWTLEVHNDGKPQNRAYLKEWTLILYGTSEDPNKHLDPAATSMPPMSASTPPNHHQLQQQQLHHGGQMRPAAPTSSSGQPAMPSGRLPVSPAGGGANLHPSVQSSSPPAPSFVPSSTSTSPTSSHQGAEIESIVAHKKPSSHQNNNQAASSSSAASLPPPPLPPGHLPPPSNANAVLGGGGAMLRPTQMPSQDGQTTSSSASSSTSTSSSYVTTFKTAAAVDSSQAATRPPISDDDNGRLTTTQSSLGGNGNRFGSNQQQPINSNGHMIKTDFEIVAPPVGGSSSGSQLKHWMNGDTNDDHDHDNHQPTTTTQTTPINQMSFQNDSNTLMINKPSIDQIDQQLATNRPTTTTVSNDNNLQQNRMQQQTTNKNNNNFDGFDSTNQLDSKLTKDYRSSGGQQQHQQPTTTTSTTTQVESDTNGGVGGQDDPSESYSSSSITTSSTTTTRQQGNAASPSLPPMIIATLTMSLLVAALVAANRNINPIVRFSEQTHKLIK